MLPSKFQYKWIGGSDNLEGALDSTASHSAGTRHVALLDGMRGAAAMVVVLGHVGLVGLYNALPVDFFFLLSGYVIALAYEHKFATGMSFVTFAKVRIIRLYPTIFLGSSLMLGVVLLGFKHVEGDLAFVALMQFALIPVLAAGLDVFRISGVQWSLFFELVANAFHRLAFPWLSLRVLLLICAISLLALVLACFRYTTFTVGWWGENFWVGFPRVCFSYFAGVLVFRLTRGRMLPSFPGWLIMFAFIAISSMPNIPGVPVNALRLGILTVALPAIVVLAINARVSGALASLCLFLGEISYPLYATHHAVIVPAQYFTRDTTGPARILFDSATFVGTLVLAFVVSRLWDRPIRAWLWSWQRAATPNAAP